MGGSVVLVRAWLAFAVQAAVGERLKLPEMGVLENIGCEFGIAESALGEGAEAFEIFRQQTAELVFGPGNGSVWHGWFHFHQS